MFVLNKKRVYVIFICLIMSVIVFETSNIQNIKTEETVALPVNKKIIIIDAGHRWRRSEVL